MDIKIFVSETLQLFRLDGASPKFTAFSSFLQTTKVASCCQLEEFLTLKTYGNCLNTMAEKYPNSTLDYLVCGLDCTYREMGILTGVDDINVEQISTNQAVYGEAYQEAIGKAVDACLAQRDEFREQEKFTKSECGMFALKFQGCIMVESMRNCPAERWDSSVLCEKVRSGVAVCPP
nr:odorant-binding protein AgamOBP51 [Anopheles gambiae]